MRKKQITGIYHACKINKSSAQLPLKSMFRYTLEGERVWDYTCMKVSRHCFTLEDGRTRHVRMWNLFVHSDFCCCFNTTPTDRDSATENNWNICFPVFPEFNWFHSFLSPGKHISAFQPKGCTAKPYLQTLGSVKSMTNVCPKTRTILGRGTEMFVQSGSAVFF